MLEEVRISSEAFQVCLTHALSTEKEEIIGLLIGDVQDNIANVFGVHVFQRSDRKKDRVEIPTDVLVAMFNVVERLSKEAEQDLRMIGWYHSHPHITVWPSHVDARTQGEYQQLDPHFVGLIFSCFNMDRLHVERMHTTCFQSVKGDDNIFSAVQIPFAVDETLQLGTLFAGSIHQLVTAMFDEESELYRLSLRDPHPATLFTAINNALVFSQAVMRMSEAIFVPVIAMLEDRRVANEERIKVLRARLADIGAAQ